MPDTGDRANSLPKRTPDVRRGKKTIDVGEIHSLANQFARDAPGTQLNLLFMVEFGSEMAQWLQREITDRKVRGSNPTSVSRLPLSRLGQSGCISALVLPSGGMAARHRKGVTAERL
ncbi:hypothetical protein CSKR_105498 [Clonorchis sinensis]|uniref:Uncharacterized protein n=1 Tax=Clonorchis sinensis TaxID=79923 RepID=A0A3R7BZV8_CLOSI|nr:hypothetical protein CSKR_105498 [Clonorchis sinensis]